MVNNFEERHPGLKGKVTFNDAKCLPQDNPMIDSEIGMSIEDLDTQIDKTKVREAIALIANPPEGTVYVFDAHFAADLRANILRFLGL